MKTVQGFKGPKVQGFQDKRLGPKKTSVGRDIGERPTGHGAMLQRFGVSTAFSSSHMLFRGSASSLSVSLFPVCDKIYEPSATKHRCRFRSMHIAVKLALARLLLNHSKEDENAK